MPTPPDANGLIRFQGTDSFATAEQPYNTILQNVSDVLAHKTYFTVANETARDDLYNVVGATSAQPLLVYRVNADLDKRFEWTINGVSWYTLTSYTDSNWTSAGIGYRAGWYGWNEGNYKPLQYRIYNGLVFVNGAVKKTSSWTNNNAVADLPMIARPGRTFENRGGAGITANGTVVVNQVVSATMPATAILFIDLVYPLYREGYGG